MPRLICSRAMRSSWMQSFSLQKSLDGTLANHMPEKPGLPSGVRGAGAFRSGAPLAKRGIPGVGWLSHCARPAAGIAINSNTADNRALKGLLLNCDGLFVVSI